jgi:hypothetical protein
LTISEERKKRVIDLYYNEGKTTREIAKIERMSIRDISIILKEEESKRQKYKDQQQQEELSSRAYKLFSEKKSTVEVAIELNLREPVVTKLYREYLKLKQYHKLNLIHKETNGKLWTFLKLYKELIKKRHMSIEQVANIVDTAIHKLPHMENLYRQAKDQAEKMQHTIQRLANDIRALEYKISILDKIAFSSEQECKKKERLIEELTAQKDRLEKMIANILNGEDYSKLKAIVKENVKAVLSDNKKLILVSFAAIIQVLKADPQMVNLIYDMPTTANDRKQLKNSNDNNNIAKYLECNKDKILDLAEKNYQNLVEVLTNNVIVNTTTSFYSTLLVPLSSSIFSGLLNQSDIHRIAESEIYHNSKEDIAE